MTPTFHRLKTRKAWHEEIKQRYNCNMQKYADSKQEKKSKKSTRSLPEELSTEIRWLFHKECHCFSRWHGQVRVCLINQSKALNPISQRKHSRHAPRLETLFQPNERSLLASFVSLVELFQSNTGLNSTIACSRKVSLKFQSSLDITGCCLEPFCGLFLL